MARSLKYRLSESAKEITATLFGPSRELNIYLVRHMLTEANINPSLHQTIADKAIKVAQGAHEAGEKAAQYLSALLYEQYKKSPRQFGSLLVIYSPYERTQDSVLPHLYYLGEKFGTDPEFLHYRADDRLIELRTGLRDGLRGEEYEKRFSDADVNFKKHKEYDAEAYAKSPMGEGYIDLSWRVRQVYPSILDDYQNRSVRHCIVVSHGGTTRAFVQGLLNYTPQWMISETNPDNNWIRHIKGTPRSGIIPRPEDYRDCGYIYGDKAPLHNPKATQEHRQVAKSSFVILPQRPNDVVPPGTKIIDPFAAPRRS
jgi:broad specificity phosphatase PhoE